MISFRFKNSEHCLENPEIPTGSRKVNRSPQKCKANLVFHDIENSAEEDTKIPKVSKVFAVRDAFYLFLGEVVAI